MRAVPILPTSCEASAVRESSIFSATVSNLFRCVSVNGADGKIVGYGADDGWRREGRAEWAVSAEGRVVRFGGDMGRM